MGTSGPWEIYQQGTYAPDANDHWLGSIAMDKHGNIVLGFHVSGANEFPSLHYAGRRPNDPLGTLPLGELTLIDGNGAQLNDSFFGDYSQMAIDPSDDCTFWYTGTYYPETGNATHWHTRIGAFRFWGLRSIAATASHSASSPNSARMKKLTTLRSVSHTRLVFGCLRDSG